jgi:RAMA domain-containing protein/GIY-YIG catalytic domain-containing protein
MKKKTDGLVSEFFEKISSDIFNYPKIINEMIKGRAGLYALYQRDRHNKDQLYYVGLTVNLKGRLKAHLRDHHVGKWNRFSVYLVTEDEHTKPLESLVLRIVSLPGNAVKGRLPGAINLERHIKKQVKDFDANKQARMFGSVAVKKRIKAKSKPKGTLSLNGVLEHRYPLRGSYRDKQYLATLRKDGQISFQGKLYPSPTAAAKMIVTEHAVNGRTFWKYKNDDGQWVALSHLIG